MSTERQQELGLRETGPVSRVDTYTFEPIRGYPMLQWAGKRPFTSTQYYPAQHKETYGPEVEGWRNKLYWGDNLQVMSHLLKEYRGKVKLVYIDPPFDSKADYKRTIQIKGQLASSDQMVFEEKQYTDIWVNDEYLQFMYERLILVKELLDDGGALYLHCDWHKSHYLRLILDEIFGMDNFVNEIIWKRRGGLLNQTRQYGVATDTILFYVKSSSYIWNQQYSKYDTEDYVQERFKYVDENGRRYRLSPIVSPSYSPNLIYEYKGYKPPKNGWSLSFETMQRFESEGRLYFPDDKNQRIQRKQYLDEWNGRVVQNLWDDIPPVNPMAGEKIDYPTQKPELLLERIIRASSRPGDLIFDCFMGSGTTQSIAMKLGRRFIGADINLGAVQITTKRLLAVSSELDTHLQKLFSEDNQPAIFYTGFEMYNVNNYDIFRNPAQAKELLIQALEVNPFPAGSLFDGEKDGRMVKVMPINRIATRQDLNDLLTGFDYRTFEKRQAEHPNQVVERVTLVCMGHEPDLAAVLAQQMAPFKLDIQVVDILRDKQDLQFKREAEAKIVIREGYLVIEQFYPMNLMMKLSLQKEYVENWRELVDSIMIDWNYDGAVLQPTVIDVPEGNALVAGRYHIPDDAGTIRVKITDLLSESLEMELKHG